jgi:hypothetical protein
VIAVGSIACWRSLTLEKSLSKVGAAKISKTTPCKVAGSRHGYLESKLTRRANQRHFFTIPQSLKRPSLCNNAARRLIAAQNLTPPWKLHRLTAADDRLRVAKARSGNLDMNTAPDLKRFGSYSNHSPQITP